jgi:Molecular chaperone
MCAANHQVAGSRSKGWRRVPAGNQLVVQLDLDLNGMLRVSAREKATGLQKQITIQNALAHIEGDARQAQARLDRLWAPPGGPMDEEDLVDELMAGLNGYDDEDDAAEAPPVLAMPELSPAPREGQRETVQARALLEKAERIRDKASPRTRLSWTSSPSACARADRPQMGCAEPGLQRTRRRAVLSGGCVKPRAFQCLQDSRRGTIT